MTYRSDGIGTQIRVLNPETMRLDTIPSIDTYVYDSLCGGVYTLEDYVLPADTTQWKPIGFIEVENIELSVFVNNQRLYFEIGDEEIYKYSVINSLGQTMFSGTTSEGEKELSDLASGVYFVEFTNKQNIESIKFVFE